MQMIASLSMYFNFIYMLMLFCVAFFYGIVSNTIHNHKSCCYSSNG